MTKARRTSGKLRNRLNSGVRKPKRKPRNGVHLPTTRARKTSSQPNNGDNQLKRRLQTGAQKHMIKAERTLSKLKNRLNSGVSKPKRKPRIGALWLTSKERRTYKRLKSGDNMLKRQLPPTSNQRRKRLLTGVHQLMTVVRRQPHLQRNLLSLLVNQLGLLLAPQKNLCQRIFLLGESTKRRKIVMSPNST